MAIKYDTEGFYETYELGATRIYRDKRDNGQAWRVEYNSMYIGMLNILRDDARTFLSCATGKNKTAHHTYFSISYRMGYGEEEYLCEAPDFFRHLSPKKFIRAFIQEIEESKGDSFYFYGKLQSGLEIHNLFSMYEPNNQKGMMNLHIQGMMGDTNKETMIVRVGILKGLQERFKGKTPPEKTTKEEMQAIEQQGAIEAREKRIAIAKQKVDEYNATRA